MGQQSPPPELVPLLWPSAKKKVQSAHYLAHTPHDAKLSLERALLKKNVCVRCIFSVYCKPVGKEL